MKFGEVLVNLGMITQQQLEIALKEQEYNLNTVGYSEPIGNILLRNAIISEDMLEKALIEYFKQLSENEDEPPYVRETAKIAYKAMISKSGENKLSENSKMVLAKAINDYEEKISQFKRSIDTLSRMEQKNVIKETIAKEKKEIEKLLQRIQDIRQDLEVLS